MGRDRRSQPSFCAHPRHQRKGLLMQRPIYFCKKWFAAKKYAPEVWTEEQAKDAHDNGRNYTVLVDSLERPLCVILVMANGIAVDFLDAHLREALSYQFQVV